MYKTLQVMKATETEGVKLASYKLRGPAHSWFEMLEDSHRDGSPLARWNEFVDAFMDHFLPAETMAARATEFEILKLGNMSVWEYHMEFVRLSKYVPQLVSTMDVRGRRFVQGLSPLVATEARKLKIRAERESNSRDRSAGHSRGLPVQGRGPIGPSQSYAQSSSSAPPSGMGRGFAQSSGSSAATSSVCPPDLAERGALRGGV
uniref:Uncharacterized protein LOC104248504 n=1 Tax=Nicotiana sylvestris TaxID=4096 RepID=A0A1U7YIX2_NICSY|nr:PREDICTED: uncharacterized protein LOC104248504 [Nicotiana sylvestris]